MGVKEQILSLKPWLVGKDPLEIDKLYTQMGTGTSNLSGTRTDGSAHNLMRAVSGMIVERGVPAARPSYRTKNGESPWSEPGCGNFSGPAFV